MIDAARWRKARATAGSHRHRTRNHKLVPLITSTVWQNRFNGRGETVLFRETEATEPIRHGGRESTSQLRVGLQLEAVAGHQATMRSA
ncbi:hypothetical protein [Nitrospira sp. BLG_1]|uniref:hypothetical protein n=1 Tax=Nitrospira sp. BLG_1 TaxID=3395883 RepID=UPI0039BD4A3A